MMHTPTPLLLDLYRLETPRRVYDNATVISTAPRFRHLRTLAGLLVSAAYA